MDQDILAAWFEKTVAHTNAARYKDNRTLNNILDAEIAALRALATGHATPEDTALAITRPISNTPIPDLGSYSDQSVAVIQLFSMLSDALVSWPKDRRPELITLLSAMGKAPGTLHNGELRDEDGKARTWASYPWLPLVWFVEGPGRFPGEIVARIGGNPTAVEAARKTYLERKEIEAQLFAVGALKLDSQFIELEVARTFERDPDYVVPGDEDSLTAHLQNRLDFQVPAFGFLMANAGVKVFDIIAAQERGLLRWERWIERLGEIANEEGHDEITHAVARMACQEMQDAKSRA